MSEVQMKLRWLLWLVIINSISIILLGLKVNGVI